MKLDLKPTTRASTGMPVTEAAQRERRTLVVAIFTLDAVTLGLAVAATDLIRLWLELYVKIWPLAAERPLVDRLSLRSAADDFVAVFVLNSKVSSWLLVRGAPALIAVLAGRMSLVGPRPAASDQRAASAPSLAVVRPGITGPWRLRGTEASLDDQAIGDLAYVRDYRIWEDVRILLVTFWRLRNDAHPLGRWWRDGEVTRPGSLGPLQQARMSA